jgi:glycosyltransferase involved in cell wall biosynthesis
MNKISVIIPTRNRTHEVIRCIESILTQTLPPHEIIVVDSSDTLELKSQLNLFHSVNIRHVHTEEIGATVQRNIGANQSVGDILVFVDDDVILDKNYLEGIMDIFNADLEGKVGGVNGDNIASDVIKENKGFMKFFSFGYQIFATIFLLPHYGNGKFLPSGFYTTIRSGSVDKSTNVEYLFGRCFAFRKKVFDEFKFDENLRGYCLVEMQDISYRVSRKYQNVYTPHISLIHNPSARRPDEYKINKVLAKNHYYLFKKNFPQTLKYRFAFWWSIVGLLIVEMTKMAVLRRGISGLKGLMHGIVGILRKDKQKEM